MAHTKSAARCRSRPTVHLDVLSDLPPRPAGVAKSRNSRKRAIVLGSIQLLILLHIALWLGGAFGGKTLTPVEPSEAMMTIEKGIINAGAIMFAVALLSTVIFGRFFCGWGCHIIMLQDLCAWIMKRCGIRPKPFRSRVLIWAPLGIAIYMFVWPTFKRLAVLPIIERFSPGALGYFQVPAEWGGWAWHLTTNDFWATFPVVMAIPTLLIVGFAAVYFLGAKGFCTYGCPYGGFFAPLDEWAPGRIRVTEDCEQCGHCTATCTSNVRVHEEVREFGMVVDPGCMKCMDCVSVCPKDALYFGFGAPAAKKGAPRDKGITRSYDLSFREDLVLGVVFLLLLFAWRGMYIFAPVPFLMAVGLAGIGAFIVFKSWRVFAPRRELVSIQNLRLKSSGRMTRAAWVCLAITFAFAGLSVQGIIVHWHEWRADVVQRMGISVPREMAFSPDNAELVPQRDREVARKAIAHLHRTRGLADGGFALMTNRVLHADLAWLHVVRGEFHLAASELRQYIDATGERDLLCADLMRLMLLDDRPREAITYGQAVLARHPDFAEIARLLAVLEEAAGARS